MILRSIGVRHGRRALSTPIASASLRRITTGNGLKAAVAPATEESQKSAQILANHLSRVPMKKVIRPVGSEVWRRYQQDDLLDRPLQPRDITLERLMAAQTHMGHHTSLWNPANSRYIYGVRQGIHIISLETTAAHLRRAATVVEEVSYRGGLVLFAGTRRDQMEIVTEAAREAKACHLFTKWTPGSITNRDIILRDRFVHVVNEKDEILPGFDKYIPQTRPILPDLVVCFNPLENYTMLYECGLAGIPTIGVIDTDADPSWVTYTIPANDDSLRSIGLIGSVLGQAGKQGQKRRLAEAEDGNVTWQTPQDITKFIEGMAAQRGEILSSIVDAQLVGGAGDHAENDGPPDGPPEGYTEPLSDAYAQGQREAAAEGPVEAVDLPDTKATTTTEEDSIEADLEKESEELFKELSESTIEMDEMSRIENEILEMFQKEKAAITEQAIMSGVGVEEGIPEGQAEATPVEKQVEAALARAEAEASIVEEQLKNAAAVAEAEAKKQETSARKEAQAEAGAVNQEVLDALAKAQAQVKALEEQLKRGKDE